jgi:hypothetical protein
VDCNYSKQSHNYWICNPNNGKTIIWDKILHQERGVDEREKAYTLRNEGECGTNGKNPGKGGSGGLSGFSGVFIHKINSISHRTYDNSLDRLGINGNHGKAGLGGYRGDWYERIYYIREIPVYAKALSFGLAGLGDINGFASEVFPLLKILTLPIVVKDIKFWFPWDRSIPSENRCHSTHAGYNPTEKNSKSQIQPKNSHIDLYSHETEYLKFISNQELKESKLQERNFYKLLLKGKNTL